MVSLLRECLQYQQGRRRARWFWMIQSVDDDQSTIALLESRRCWLAPISGRLYPRRRPRSRFDRRMIIGAWTHEVATAEDNVAAEQAGKGPYFWMGLTFSKPCKTIFQPIQIRGLRMWEEIIQKGGGLNLSFPQGRSGISWARLGWATQSRVIISHLKVVLLVQQGGLPGYLGYDVYSQ